MQSFDLVVIGTGSAGKTVAEAARQAGKTVAIIDKLPFGGTCSQRGCDPKKVLVGAAEIIARSEQLVGKGVQGKASINWLDLIQFKKTFVESIPERTEKQFADEGIVIFHGAATFVSENTVRVDDHVLQAKHIVIATGQRPKPLGIPGEELLTDSTGFMELADLPEEIVMIGGGYIAFEFAHVAARAGSNVTILHQGKRPLEGFDADLVKLLVKAMEAVGIKIELEASVTEVKGDAGKLTVAYKQKGKVHAVSTQLVVHGAGRVADVAELALEKAGVEVNEKGVTVNEFLQSVSNPAVYVCGDASDKGLPLTPLASYEGKIVAENILNGNKQTYTNDPVPSAVFTIPTLASVGLTEEQAKEQGRNVKVTFQETTDWYNSRRINEQFTGFKTLVDAETDQILGAHLLGSGSDELINLFTLAMKHGISARELGKTLFAYPTHGSDLSSMLPE
ncbi:NAD(P)/FAD-dependent oxidoreductase [Spirosoma sp. KCTC 42546]|uniref:dihydrolipoyl dehydrogenase family protein n=1 Tax=Spirosoma sp. KCTC 42546 TaxID=2520506 RepID=UPI001158D876|nr:NAD(P)/FAD-dependent oxidoreductase [Spirosoma sp. KCTC 42546]QDK79285.1 NAD(P)/FAD-dependent oxidoreductase [Spirosoma sp. KCTC 42546]